MKFELGMRNCELGIPTPPPSALDEGGWTEIQNSKFKIQNPNWAGE
jgi:hypothetical protein